MYNKYKKQFESKKIKCIEKYQYKNFHWFSQYKL